MGSTWRRLLRPRTLLILMAAFYVVVSVGVGAVLLSRDLAAAREALDQRDAEVARLLEEHAHRTLDAAEMVVRRVGDRLDGQRGGDGAALAARIAAIMADAPYIANIYVVDATGRLMADGKDFHPAGSNFADREWVRTVLGEGRAAAFIGPAAFDTASRSFAFPLARRVVADDGRVLAAVAALVDVDYFKRFYQELKLGPAQAFGIFRLDGAALVRQPLKVEDVGMSFANAPLIAAAAERRQGVIASRSIYDAIERRIAYRVMAGRDLVVWAGVSESGMWEAWRGRALATLALAGLGLVAMLGLTALLLRELRREQRASANLASLNRDLERSNADLEQFAHIASHDLKEPLRNIASYVQLLQRRYQGQLDPDADAFIGYTVDGVRRLQAIINELLAYSRIGTGQLSLVAVPAGALVSTALAHLKGVIAEAQAAVEVKGPLPVVEADAAQLGSLFQNLIANGLKYRRDDVRPEVTIGFVDRGDHWDFYVRDNGIGIDQQYHRQIFDLFKRLHPRDRYPGTGIGLAICQRVVERHGGCIWVDSRAGHGSTFWFSLPKSRSV